LGYVPVNAVGFSVLAAFSSRVLEKDVIKNGTPNAVKWLWILRKSCFY